MTLDPLNDFPRNSYYMDEVMASDDGTPYVRPNMVCIFERYEGDIAWHHTECPISGMEVNSFFFLKFLSNFIQIKINSTM